MAVPLNFLIPFIKRKLEALGGYGIVVFSGLRPMKPNKENIIPFYYNL